MIDDSSHFTPLDDEYETCKRTFAEYRVYGYYLDPESVTMALGIQPSKTQERGEVREGFDGRQIQPPTSGWFLSSEGHVLSADVRCHLDWLLERLLPAKEQILALQKRSDVKMAVVCLWWSEFGDGGPALWPKQMSLLVELNLECSFELAFFGSDEAEVS